MFVEASRSIAAETINNPETAVEIGDDLKNFIRVTEK